MSYYTPYFPNIVANVPTDNPWLLSQMTYNAMPTKGPSASLDQIFQDASQFLGRGGIAPAAPPSSGTEAPAPAQMDVGGAPNTTAPQGPTNVSGALTGRGVAGLNAFNTLTAPFGNSPISPFSVISTLGQTVAAPTTIDVANTPQGTTLAGLGFGPSAQGVMTGPNTLSVIGDEASPNIMSSLIGSIMSSVFGMAPTANQQADLNSQIAGLAMMGGLRSSDFVGRSDPFGTMALTAGTIGGPQGNSTYSGNSTFSGATMNSAELSAALAALANTMGFGRTDTPPDATTGGSTSSGTAGTSAGEPSGIAGTPSGQVSGGEMGIGSSQGDVSSGGGGGTGSSGTGGGGAPGGSGDSPAMHSGGRIPGRSEKTYRVLGGETIMNREASKAFSPYLDAMNKIQDEHSDNASTLKRLINKAVLHLAG